MGGWIKLYRDLLDKPIWVCSTHEQRVILVTILLLANHADKQWEWKGKQFTCKPGQFITSLPSLAKASYCSIQKVRTALKRLEAYEFLTDESTSSGRLITVLNWAKYQDSPEEVTDELTDGQQTPNRPLTPNKNIKNIKNDKEITNAFFEECWSLYPEKKGKGKISDTQRKKLYKLGDELKRCISRYLAFVDSERNRGFDLSYKHGATFFNSGYVDYLDENYKESTPTGPHIPDATKYPIVERPDEGVRRDEVIDDIEIPF